MLFHLFWRGNWSIFEWREIWIMVCLKYAAYFSLYHNSNFPFIKYALCYSNMLKCVPRFNKPMKECSCCSIGSRCSQSASQCSQSASQCSQSATKYGTFLKYHIDGLTVLTRFTGLRTQTFQQEQELYPLYDVDDTRLVKNLIDE